MGAFHRRDSEDKLKSLFVYRQPNQMLFQGGVGVMKGLGMGKEVSQNDKPTTGQRDVVGVCLQQEKTGRLG